MKILLILVGIITAPVVFVRLYRAVTKASQHNGVSRLWRSASLPEPGEGSC